MLRLDETFYNPVKHKLQNQEKVVGAWLQMASPYAAEIFAKAGLDVLMIDLEHSPNDILSLVDQLRAIEKFDAVPFARAPWNDQVALKRILDAGVYGVLVPYVNTAQEARKAVAACQYPPQGVRGVAPSPRAAGFGMNSLNYLKHANDEIAVMIAVETPEAVANLDEILQVEGLDGIFIGPMDLATSMGYFCNPAHPEVQAAIRQIEEKVKASGKFLASIAGDFNTAEAMYERGYNLLLVMADGGTLGRCAREAVSWFANTFPNR